MNVHLKSFYWMIVPQADFQAIQAGSPLHQTGYAEAASIQTIYFTPGIIPESLRIRKILEPLNTDFPTIEQIQTLMPKIDKGLGLYKYEENEDVWHIRYHLEPDWDGAFKRKGWVVLAQTAKEWKKIHEGESIRGMLDLFEFLNGDHTRDQITANLSGNNDGLALLQGLFDFDLVEEKQPIQINISDIPEFLFLGHSGLTVRSGEDMIVIDPVVVPETRTFNEPDLPVEYTFNQARAVVLTHGHWDHVYYPTLARIRRDMKMIVPRVTKPTIPNPPVAAYLSDMGFTNIVETEPGEVFEFGEVTLHTFPFFGESFGLESHFDAYTYHVQFGEHSIYGSVDTCQDEAGSMENTIAEVARLGPVDFFLFGSSGQKHQPAYLAGMPRHFSNELIHRPDLITYHPTVEDALRWTKILNPRVLIPYAMFLFQGKKYPDIKLDSITGSDIVSLAEIPDRFTAWADGLRVLAMHSRKPIQLLQPMQGFTV